MASRMEHGAGKWRGKYIRLMRGPYHVGTLLKLMNGRWGVYDKDEQVISALNFQQPSMARDKFDELTAGDDSLPRA